MQAIKFEYLSSIIECLGTLVVAVSSQLDLLHIFSVQAGVSAPTNMRGLEVDLTNLNFN